MTSSRRSPIVLFLAFICAALGTSVASGQQPPGTPDASATSVAAYSLSQQMPIDPEAVVGRLPNGLRYYVRANPKPAHRAELRLVVKAGSVLEDDDQRGLAHFVEHMEFEGTRHFPGSTLVDFLASLGLSIGPDANAATGYNDTQYTLRVPTDVPGVLDRALLVLQDWAEGATFDQRGIDRERGIVLSEWRMNLGAGERTQTAVARVQLDGSRYAARPVIGDPDIISNASRAALTRFYHDWYRPDLMAVIAVGDIDRDAVVAMLTDHFSSLTAPAPERPRPVFDVPDHPGARYAIIPDKETTSTAVELTDLRPSRNQGSVGGYRDIIRDQLFTDMMNARLSELRDRPNPPFLRAAAERSLFSTAPTRDEAVVEALVTNDGVPRGLDALMTELQRVARFGFTATELDRAKQAMMLTYERAVTESPDRESSSRADEYTRNFMQDEALPTIWQELAFHRRFVPSITLAEVNALVRDWFPDTNRIVIVSTPQTSGGAPVTEAQLAAVMNGIAAKRLEPYVDAVAHQRLLDMPPQRGSIVRVTPREAGITEWTLSNGATVVLKPTTLRADQILFRAVAPGGTSRATDAEFPTARVTDSIIPAGGVDSFSATMLDRMLSGKAIAVTPFIDETQEGMAGGSTPQDLETMFQLLYLRFTQPRADATAFATIASQVRALVANESASPDTVFDQAVDEALSGDNPRRRPITGKDVDRWNLNTALTFYKGRFADAANFTFVFVGSFTVDAIRPLVETYIAGLPATHSHETWRDLGIRPPTMRIEKTIVKGIAPKSAVAIVLSGPFEYTEDEKLAMRTVTLLLQSRLFDTIRQDLGGTYSITANFQSQKYPDPEYRLRIEWTCDPARTEALVDRVWQEIAYVKGLRLSQEQLQLIRESLLRDFERESQDNGYLLNQIVREYDENHGENVAKIENLPERIRALTSAAIHDAAMRYLGTDNAVRVTLVPETKQ